MTLLELNRLIESIPLGVGTIAQRMGRNESTVYRWKRGRTHPSVAEIELLRHLSNSFIRTANGRPDFRFVDLFAGIGGMRRGVEAVGGHCVFTCERDRFCRRSYEANFSDGPEHPFATDIRE